MPTMPIEGSHIVAIPSPLEGPEEYRRVTVIVEHNSDGGPPVHLMATRWGSDGVVHGKIIDLAKVVAKGSAFMLRSPVPAAPCVAWILRPSMKHPGDCGRKHLRLLTRNRVQVISEDKQNDHRIMLVPEPATKTVRFEFASMLAQKSLRFRESNPEQAKLLLARAIMLCPDKERKAEYQALRADMG